MADLSAKRELNRGAGDAMSMAFELAVTPALLALIGWRIDVWLGTTPLFLVVLFAFTIGYEIWKLLTRYDETMRKHEARMPWSTKRRTPGESRS